MRAYTEVDAERELELAQYRWHMDSQGYAVRSEGSWRRGTYRKIRMHRQIMAAPDGLEVDHINRNKLDNRHSNLRLVQSRENAQNLGKRKAWNGQPPSSQYRGVSWAPRIGKFSAKVTVRGKQIWLGYFLDEHEAGRAAAEAREKFMTHAVESAPASRKNRPGTGERICRLTV